MRRASISLLSHLSCHKSSSFAPILSRNYISDPSSSSSSPLVSPTHLKPCAKTHGLFLKPCQFRTISVRSMDTLSEKPDQTSSGPGKMLEKSELEKAFESAETAEEMLKSFKDMESDCDKQELGYYSLMLGAHLDLEDEDPEKVLSFANRALKLLIKMITVF
ncbi:hypothetical protein SLA2020_338740 [Shorea laevis]